MSALLSYAPVMSRDFRPMTSSRVVPSGSRIHEAQMEIMKCVKTNLNDDPCFVENCKSFRSILKEFCFQLIFNVESYHALCLFRFFEPFGFITWGAH